MAKVYKAVVYVTDYNDEIADLDSLKYRIEDGLSNWIGVKVAEAKESESFEWEDDLMINKTYAQVDDYEAYFKD